MSILFGPSLLSADFSRLEEEIRQVERGGADFLHLDVMDGHFVPNITFGPVIVEAIRKLTSLPLDVHLMIAQPDRYWMQFKAAGADWISLHVETGVTPELINEMRREVKTGIAINPNTPLEVVEPYIEEVDFVLVMTVNPGFGGQRFISTPLQKVKELSQRGVKVEVDGGINEETIHHVLEAGASLIVSGSSVFKRGNPYARTVLLKSIIQEFEASRGG